MAARSAGKRIAAVPVCPDTLLAYHERPADGGAEDPSATTHSTEHIMTTIGLDRIGQIAINVKDVPRAIAFYRDVLGMRFLFEAPGLGFFACGGVRLMLSRPESPEFDHPASLLYYAVDDIQVARDALVERGVTFESEPHVVHRAVDHDLWIGFFRDGEGNLLGIMSEVARA